MLTDTQARNLRAGARLADKTWLRYIRGQKIQPVTIERIEAAARELRIPLTRLPHRKEQSA
jgi:hypothetical protein